MKTGFEFNSNAFGFVLSSCINCKQTLKIFRSLKGYNVECPACGTLMYFDGKNVVYKETLRVDQLASYIHQKKRQEKKDARQKKRQEKKHGKRKARQ